MANSHVSKHAEHFEVVHPHAAGIDTGKNFFDVCARPGVVKRFGSYTEELEEIGAYLHEHHIQTVAIESTGPYWKNLFVLLQAEGFEVYLINPSYAKNVRNRKSDRVDAQWLRKMHSCGLLPNSFQPGPLSEQLRSLTRHRQHLLDGANRALNQVNKCLVLLNLRLDRILSKIGSKSGQRLIEAIIDGERDPHQLVQLLDKRIKTPPEECLKALKGLWRAETLFELKQCYELYQFQRQQMRTCETQIQQLLEPHLQQVREQPDAPEPFEPGKKKYPQPNDPAFDLFESAYLLSGGVDLSPIIGVGATTVLTLLAEVGVDDLKRQFPSAKKFAAWLCLTPNRKISGGKVLSSRVPKNRNPLRKVLLSAANTIGQSKEPSALRSFFHKRLRKGGRTLAIMATARKLAIIIYHMLTRQEAYRPMPPEDQQQQQRQQALKRAKRTIKQFGLTPEEVQIAFQ